MVSSTFTDLRDHRAAIAKAIDAQELKSVVMENDSAKPDGDVIDSSIAMVEKSSAYVAIVSHKYGQIPKCSTRNPNDLSLTELEFNRALELERPILLFIMGDDHQVKPSDVEIDPDNRQKLVAFRERAKLSSSTSLVHRVYKVFNDLQEFHVAATQSVAALRRFLDEQADPPPPTPPPIPKDSNPEGPEPIPSPPEFYAEPPYIGSHDFVGRKAQLETLSDWASAADPHPVLLFEAIGGTGKSMLTWEWIRNHATTTPTDWAGRFWYSFYEKGAIMSDFCQRALAYITGQPLKDFRKQKTAALAELLLQNLRLRPYLLVLDGLERVLVAYHRIDAAQLADEDAGTSDEIAHRDPCAAIRPEDEDLLRALAGAAPSKILITSRLTPKVLINAANQPLPGVLRERLPGLRPADAEALLRSCGVTGTSQDMQGYLQTHCDCHPLVTGVIAGLINNYFPARGNFDIWVDAPDGGGAFNFANLDLIQKRNHILTTALAAVPTRNRQVLSILALLSESIDSATLSALNPFLPPEPEEVGVTKKPKDPWFWRWIRMSDKEKEKARKTYAPAAQNRRNYEEAVAARLRSTEFRAADGELAKAVQDLERRGLLQYDPRSGRYDLHPVVRGVAGGGLQPEETERYGMRVVDHFTRQAHNPYDEAETLDDLRDSLHLIRTLLRMGRYQQALGVYRGDLANTLHTNLEANAEVLSLVRPFFPQGWDILPDDLSSGDSSYLLNSAANALSLTGESDEALTLFGAALALDLEGKDRIFTSLRLTNIAIILLIQNRPSKCEAHLGWALEIATLNEDEESVFRARVNLFWVFSILGMWENAQALWEALDPMGRDWNRAVYRPGEAESLFAQSRFFLGTLQEEHLSRPEQLAIEGRNRLAIRVLRRLRGEWKLEHGQWEMAAESLHTAVALARAVGQSDARTETLLVVARYHLSQLSDPVQEAERLSQIKKPFNRGLAELWRLIGDTGRAKEHALAAYKWAWADGEPYVRRYELDKTRALLEQLEVEPPHLPSYDPVKDEPLPWETEVIAAIEKLRAQKEEEEAAQKADSWHDEPSR